jgi:beta-RFAP synthase
MSSTILISTGARLHFGFFAHSGAESRPGALNYGGVGLMIDAPGFVLAASKPDADPRERTDSECWTELVECNLNQAQAAQSDPFGGPPAEARPGLCARVSDFLKRYRERSHEAQPVRCSIELRAAIPSHRGLGAGTQLGMAVGKAWSLLAGEQSVDAVTLAQRVGRGARSAIGIHGFEQGGFLIDAGKQRDGEVGRLEARVDVPTEWRFLLVNPPDAAAGLSGKEEAAALSRLPSTSPEMTERLRRLALSEMLPALKSSDCDRFGEAVFEFGQTGGEYFRPIQAGVYATPGAGALVEWIRGQGFPGVAQTSWGPTLAVCCADQKNAELLREKISADHRWQECSTRIVAPLNTGATIEQISSADSR